MHTLFREAGLEAPYVFASHSIAGINDRLYQQRHPDEVAGFVMVDASFEELFEALGEVPIKNEGSLIDYTGAITALRASRDLGAMPLIVLHARRRDSGEALWLATHKHEAALSSDSVLIQANSSGHLMQVDQPDLVIAAIRTLSAAVAEDRSLPACEQIAEGLRATCLDRG
jgi:pimeloyl-ACP methyl ester carboxylesterase